MPNLSSKIITLRSALSRFVRGLILLTWILVLSFVALSSLDGSMAKSLLSKAPEQRPDYLQHLSNVLSSWGGSEQKKECPTADQILSDFNYWHTNAAPVDSLLDVLNPNWKHSKDTNDHQCTKVQAKKIDESFNSLYSKIEKRLRSVAKNDNADPKSMVIDSTILPPEFKDKNRTEANIAVKLPELQDWITAERIRIKQNSKRLELLGTFLLLSVLGAFGALIFLIRDYISLDEEKKLSHYIFRPVLGIFLAISVFVVDILAHTVISTASILEIRYEPLYILALGAGLLSERAYDAIRRRVDTALVKYGGSSAELKDSKQPEEKT